jgi:hypothetical protein
MRMTFIEAIKSDIERNYKNFLREEGIELYIAANDNCAPDESPLIEIESVEDSPLEGSALLSEIKVILGVLGKPSQCEALVNGLYESLLPHRITHRELTVLLMSLHVEAAHCVRPRCQKKRAVMRYIVEKTPVLNDNEEAPPAPEKMKDAEFC